MEFFHALHGLATSFYNLQFSCKSIFLLKKSRSLISTALLYFFLFLFFLFMLCFCLLDSPGQHSSFSYCSDTFLERERERERESTVITLIYQKKMAFNVVTNFALSQMSNCKYNNIHWFTTRSSYRMRNHLCLNIFLL